MKYEIYPHPDGQYTAFAIKDDGTCFAVKHADSFEEVVRKIKAAVEEANLSPKQSS